MSWKETIHDAAPAILVAVLTTATGGAVWVVRTLLTNREEIALLKKELSGQASIREIDRQSVEDLKKMIADHRKESVESSRAIAARLDQIIDRSGS